MLGGLLLPDLSPGPFAQCAAHTAGNRRSLAHQLCSGDPHDQPAAPLESLLPKDVGGPLFAIDPMMVTLELHDDSLARVYEITPRDDLTLVITNRMVEFRLGNPAAHEEEAQKRLGTRG